MSRVAFTVMGIHHLNDLRIRKCLASWKYLPEDMSIRVVNDGTLDRDATMRIEDELGFTVVNAEELDSVKSGELRRFETLTRLLGQIRHFVKAAAVPLLASEYDRCLLLDTDVLFTCPVDFPKASPDVLICCDDTPAYRIKCSTPFRYPLVDCINSGFNYFSPSALSVEGLDQFFRESLTRSKNYWWVEQAAWSYYCGAAATKGLFDGRDARTISGLGKRTADEILSNQFTWTRRPRAISSDEIQRSLDDAAVLHFAGPGKPYIDWCDPNDHFNLKKNRRTLRWSPLENTTGLNRYKLALRLGAIRTQELLNLNLGHLRRAFAHGST